MNVLYNSDVIGTYAVLCESVGEHFQEMKLYRINGCRKILGCKKTMMGVQKGCTDADGHWRYLEYKKKRN